MNSDSKIKSEAAPNNTWQHCIDLLLSRLGDEDDAALWAIAADTVLADSIALITDYSGKEAIILEIGRCSHWIRPHWTSCKDGTRLAAGYNETVSASAYSFRSLPQFDWSLRWSYAFDRQQWSPVSGQPSRRPLTMRIAVPSRTSRHAQATIHSVWTPGSPTDPANKLATVYGFERKDSNWQLFAKSDVQQKS